MMKIVFLAPFGLHPKGTLLARMLPLDFASLQLAEIQMVGKPFGKTVLMICTLQH